MCIYAPFEEITKERERDQSLVHRTNDSQTFTNAHYYASMCPWEHIRTPEFQQQYEEHVARPNGQRQNVCPFKGMWIAMIYFSCTPRRESSLQASGHNCDHWRLAPTPTLSLAGHITKKLFNEGSPNTDLCIAAEQAHVMIMLP